MQENRVTIAQPETACSMQGTTAAGDRHLSYRARSSTLALAFILALSPIWLLWSAISAVTLTWTILVKLLTGQVLDDAYVPMACFYYFLAAVGCFTVFVCRDIKLTFNQNNISFPLRFLFEMRGKITRPWKDLCRVDFRDSEGEHNHPQHATLIFADGARVPLAISGFKREDLNELLQAIQLFAPSAEFVPALPKVKLDLVSGFEAGLSGMLEPSYTQLWEDELATRFGSTIFVPLDAGAVLQDGALNVAGQLCFGGLSAVYIARRRDGEAVILKEAVLPLGCDEALKQKALEMFGREAAILASLDHERIAGVRDYFVENGRHYIVLEHVDGIDLRRFIREQGRQSAEVALRWLAEMTEILIYLHSHTPPVVHRDVTPDNIVLARDGHLRLIDFGAANNLVGTATGTLVGKQSYISPEQFRGKASPQSDLYSLGATIYFALTATDPEPLTRLSLAVPSGLSGPGQQIYPALAKMIKELTEQDTTKRTATSQDLKIQVDQIRELLTAVGPS